MANEGVDLDRNRNIHGPRDKTPTESALSSEISDEISTDLYAGEPLAQSLRSLMPKSDVQRPFGDLRIHDGPKSHTLADKLGARAFTLNESIFFGRGQYRPSSASGRELIAHELVHAASHTLGVVRRAPPKEDEERVRLPRYLSTRIDELAQVVPDGDRWRVRFATDQVWEYDPQVLVLAA